MCTVDQEHCSQCGSIDSEDVGGDYTMSYSACCNEPIERSAESCTSDHPSE